MPSLKQLISEDQREVGSGEIVSRGTGSTYSVRVAGKVQTVRSAVGDGIPVGARVVMVATKEGRFIVGSDARRKRAERIVVIDG